MNCNGARRRLSQQKAVSVQLGSGEKIFSVQAFDSAYSVAVLCNFDYLMRVGRSFVVFCFCGVVWIPCVEVLVVAGFSIGGS